MRLYKHLIPLLLLYRFVSAETAAEISRRFDLEKAKALEAYVQAHPDAQDAFEALSRMIESFAAAGQNERALDGLALQYQAIPKGKDGVISAAAQNLEARVTLFMASKNREEAKAVFAQFEKDFDSHPQFQQTNRFRAQVASAILTPRAGESIEVSFTSLDGENIDLASLKGKVVVVDFWATWCGPCLEELPGLKDLYEKHHADGLEILGLSRDTDGETLQHFITKEKLPWPMHADALPDGKNYAAKYGAFAIPKTILIGKDGKVAATDLFGPQLEAKVEELLK